MLTKPEQRDMAAIAAATKRFNELWTIVDKVLTGDAQVLSPAWAARAARLHRSGGPAASAPGDALKPGPLEIVHLDDVPASP